MKAYSVSLLALVLSASFFACGGDESKGPGAPAPDGGVTPPGGEGQNPPPGKGGTPGDVETTSKLADEYVLTGGDILPGTEHQLFPYAVAIAKDGTVFVSTLGNHTTGVLSAIYKFAPGQGVAPQKFFEVADVDSAVYGLALKGQELFACVSPHLSNLQAQVPATIQRFQDITATGLKAVTDAAQNPAGLTSIPLSTDVVVNPVLGIIEQLTGPEELGRCANIALDGDALMVPDVSGLTSSIFRLNTLADALNPIAATLEGADVTNVDKLLLTALKNDLLGDVVGDNPLGVVSGVAPALLGDDFSFLQQNVADKIFQLDGLDVADQVTRSFDLTRTISNPTSLVPLGAGGLVPSLEPNQVFALVSSLDQNQVFALVKNAAGDVVDVKPILEGAKLDGLLNPLGLGVLDTEGLVVDSHITELLDTADGVIGSTDLFRLVKFDLPALPGVPALPKLP